MVTDTARVRRTDPGEPEKCPAFNLHKIYCTSQEIEEVSEGCRSAGIGCLDCKKVMIRRVIDDLEPFREKRALYEKRPDDIRDVIAEGNRVAGDQAATTMSEVRSVLTL